MQVLEKILEEIEKEQNSYESEHAWNYSKGLEYAKEIIRSHMDDCKTFEFDFMGVKSFDCPCGRHYVNTSSDGWIPVEERLPEDDDMRFYMCIVENHEEDLPMFCQYDNEYGFGFWHDIFDEVTLGFVDSEFKTNDELGYEKVIAWMPLPEPYKPKETTATCMEHIMSRFTKVK